MLSQIVSDFEKDSLSRVAVLHGEGGVFCAGADLTAIADRDPHRMNQIVPVDLSKVPSKEDNLNSVDLDPTGPMGFSRLVLSKPVIAAIAGYAVAGG
jgi:enoyl-CoA hydratase